MSFRRKGKASHQSDTEWRKWLDTHKLDITATGLPPGVVRSSNDWNYFLEHGYWCDEYFGKHVGNVDIILSELSPEQKTSLYRLLEKTLTDDEKHGGITVWQKLKYRNSQNEN